MPTDYARRQRSGRAEVTHLAQRRMEKVPLLIAVRDRLARAAAEFDAHDLEGAVELVQQVKDAEAAVQALVPRLYEEQWPAWVEQDVDLGHDVSQPSAGCSICRMLGADLGPRAIHTGRAG